MVGVPASSPHEPLICVIYYFFSYFFNPCFQEPNLLLPTDNLGLTCVSASQHPQWSGQLWVTYCIWWKSLLYQGKIRNMGGPHTQLVLTVKSWVGRRVVDVTETVVWERPVTLIWCSHAFKAEVYKEQLHALSLLTGGGEWGGNHLSYEACWEAPFSDTFSQYMLKTLCLLQIPDRKIEACKYWI